jgi:hypothetical protein
MVEPVAVMKNPYPSIEERVADEWFQALDRRRVVTGRQQWDILVTGVHPSGSDCWIQMAAADDARKRLLLKVSRETTVEAALEAVAIAAQQNLHVTTAGA